LRQLYVQAGQSLKLSVAPSDTAAGWATERAEWLEEAAGV